MNGREMTKNDGKRSKVSQSNKGLEIVKSHDQPHPERMWSKKKKMQELVMVNLKKMYRKSDPQYNK